MSVEPLYLESCVVPVCRFEITDGVAYIQEFFGTAFFIGSKGVFLTATHVINAGTESVQQRGGFIGLCGQSSSEMGNCAIHIKNTEAAEAPYDISLGTVNLDIPSFLTLENRPIAIWQDIASLGYPCTAQNRSEQEFWMHARGFKGYVHRHLLVGDIEGSPHPDAFEVSFSMPQGLSGGPLFTYNTASSTVIGVCVGINRGESTEFIIEEVHEDGKIFREKRVRVEEYGIAHDLRPLLTWRPSILGGRSLSEVSMQ